MKPDPPAPCATVMECTDGTLLGGRVRYAQPRDGYRTGIEPVLLAAAIPAKPGQTVLEAGTGAGAGLLCLMTRVQGLRGIGIEADPDMAALARRNAAANGLAIEVVAVDVSASAGLGPADHAFANPPWHDPAGTRPDGARRVAAKQLAAGGLTPWIDALALAITPAGTISLALPASLASQAMGLLHGAGLGRVTLIPLWPRAGLAAKIVLVQARRGIGPSTISAGLVLHGTGAGYTNAADAMLRDGGPFPA